MTTRTLEIRVDQTGSALSGLSALTSGVAGLGLIAGGAAIAGVAALGAGIYGVGRAGLEMNNSMEQASARINAFTKDSEKTAEILEMVRERAAQTPFAFNEMAGAAAALLPSAKQAQTGIEDLIAQAEILAASNPAEGLEGAAFALKEAVSGDFTSIIERFNLPRSMINQLKEEGLPNLEIVSRAMQELGLDVDLVSALANTASGRWSTFLDTLQNFAAQITQPVFDAFSSGMGRLNQLLEENEPTLSAVSNAISGVFSAAIGAAIPIMSSLIDRMQDWVTRVTPGVIQWLNNLQDRFAVWASYVTGTIIPVVLEFATSLWTWARQVIPQVIETASRLQEFLLSRLRPAFNDIWDAVDRIVRVFSEGTESSDVMGYALATLEAIMMPTIIVIKGLATALQTIAAVCEIGAQAIKDIGAVMEWLGDTWEAVWEGLTAGIRVVINAWKQLVEIVKWAAGSIPQLFVPGSPTPFETGLRGIADAANVVAESVGNMGRSIGQVDATFAKASGKTRRQMFEASNRAKIEADFQRAGGRSQSVSGITSAIRDLFPQGKIGGFGSTTGGGIVPGSRDDWISTAQAARIVVNYNPAVSLGSQAEVVAALRGAYEELRREDEQRRR